jgi:hypothetical protein
MLRHHGHITTWLWCSFWKHEDHCAMPPYPWHHVCKHNAVPHIYGRAQHPASKAGRYCSAKDFRCSAVPVNFRTIMRVRDNDVEVRKKKESRNGLPFSYWSCTTAGQSVSRLLLKTGCNFPVGASRAVAQLRRQILRSCGCTAGEDTL